MSWKYSERELEELGRAELSAERLCEAVMYRNNPRFDISARAANTAHGDLSGGELTAAYIDEAWSNQSADFREPEVWEEIEEFCDRLGLRRPRDLPSGPVRPGFTPEEKGALLAELENLIRIYNDASKMPDRAGELATNGARALTSIRSALTGPGLLDLAEAAKKEKD